MIGFCVVTYNDIHLSRQMYQSLIASLGSDSFALACVDGGSTDDSTVFWQTKCKVLHAGDNETEMILRNKNKSSDLFNRFSFCLNLGFEYLLQDPVITHIVQIHPDMRFPQKNWAENMASFLDQHDDVGRVGADQLSTPVNQRKERLGNMPCEMWPRKVLDMLIEKDGCIYDENFEAAGGYEDWDINRRLMKYGMRVMITPTAVIEHPGMLSRKNNSVEYERKNAGYYFKKWGDYKASL